MSEDPVLLSASSFHWSSDDLLSKADTQMVAGRIWYSDTTTNDRPEQQPTHLPPVVVAAILRKENAGWRDTPALRSRRSQMYDTPVFRDDDWGDLELVRQIVLRRLKEDADWHEFDRTWGDRASRFVQFDPPRLRSRFIVLANEVMWQLIIQGVITVGHGEGNPNLPWFRITDYGQKVLAAERFVPHDPTGYMAELSVIAGPLDMTVASRYAEEALACFAAGCNVASVLLLGVAAESAFNQLCDSIRPTLNDAADKAKLDLTIPVRPRHRWLVERYQNLPAAERRRLSESLDVTLTSLYDLIRKQRNDLGHPQEQPPQLSREEAFVFFRLLPTFIQDAQALAQYCASHPI